jgi:putative ABC transport system permease protein
MSRLHSTLARLLPRRFRARYAVEMSHTLAARHGEVAGASGLRRGAFWAKEITDILMTVAREWLRDMTVELRRDMTAACAGVRPAPDSTPLSLPERILEMLTNLFADLRFSLRTLAKQPLFSAVVVSMLALGIGATTAVYTLVDSVLLRPLPYDEPERLVVGYGSFPLNNTASISPPDYLDYRDRSDSFEALAAIGSGVGSVSVGGAGTPEMASTRTASHQFFETLGVSPAMGRGFSREQTVDGGPRVVVISDGFWKRRFASDPAVVGSEFLVDEEPTMIVGVLPTGFNFFGAPDLWRPLPFGAENMSVRRFHFLRVVGKLREDVDVIAAQSEIDAIAGDLEAAYPASNTEWTMRLVPLHEAAVGSVQQPLILILAAVGAVLLIGCCNVAILLLARATRREPEIAMRNALGASGGRIVRLLLSESLLLAIGGGGLGILLAYRGVDLLIAMSATALPRVDEIAVSGPVLFFSTVVTLGTGLMVGLVPALRSARRDINEALRGQGRVAAPGNQRVRNALVVGQVALSFALLVGAGLMIRSLGAMTRVEPGFAAEQIVTASVDLPDTRYQNSEQARTFFDDLFARLETMSSIDGVGGIDIMPLTGGNDTFAYPEGSPPEPGSQGFNALVRSVNSGYFEAMQIPLVRGRGFGTIDVAGGNPVVIIDEPFAAQIFPDENAVGKRIVVDLGDARVVEIVGIVGGILHFGPLTGLTGTMYFPSGQRGGRGRDIVLRTQGNPAAAIEGLRTALAEIDPQIPLANVSAMNELLSGTVAGPRFRARLLGIFAATALLLAGAGLYGLLAYFVAERRQEMGVRLALGADAGGVVRLVVRRGMSLVSIGLVIGAFAAAGLSWAIQGLLFGVSAADPTSFIGVAVMLAVVALLACLLPALRATRVDPLEVMRAE